MAHYHLVSALFLAVLPFLVIRVLFRDSLSDYGLTWGRRREWGLALILFLLFLPVLLTVAQLESFQQQYPNLDLIREDARGFWIYQGLYSIKWISSEFFFRGFLLFGFYKKFGENAILLTTIPYCIMHFGKPELEVLASIAASFVLCRLALDSRSILPGTALHFAVGCTMDLLASSWWR
jgi:membrane protease YdiL (CAAX protease family)